MGGTLKSVRTRGRSGMRVHACDRAQGLGRLPIRRTDSTDAELRAQRLMKAGTIEVSDESSSFWLVVVIFRTFSGRMGGIASQIQWYSQSHLTFLHVPAVFPIPDFA